MLSRLLKRTLYGEVVEGTQTAIPFRSRSLLELCASRLKVASHLSLPQRWRDAGEVADTEHLVFHYQVDFRYVPLLVVLGFRASHDAVRVGNGLLRAKFGWFRLETPLSNVDGAHYAPLSVVDGARCSALKGR